MLAKITVFIATKRKPKFLIVNYLFKLCCSLKTKSILEVSKIFQRIVIFRHAHLYAVDYAPGLLGVRSKNLFQKKFSSKIFFSKSDCRAHFPSFLSTVDF